MPRRSPASIASRRRSPRIDFVLHAQPIIDLRSGQVVQNELLLRMRERDGRIVAPGEFLPVAEQYALIGEIDWWVIKQATTLAGAGCPVQANLSARSVGDPDVLEHIERCVAAVLRGARTARLRDHRDGDPRGRARRADLRRASTRARLQARARRLRHRLRNAHLPQADTRRLPQARHRVRPRPREQQREPPRRAGRRRVLRATLACRRSPRASRMPRRWSCSRASASTSRRASTSRDPSPSRSVRGIAARHPPSTSRPPDAASHIVPARGISPARGTGADSPHRTTRR